MVNYTEPEPEFTAPADILSKEEPIILSKDIRQQEMDEVAERVKGMKASKIFDAQPNTVTPKTDSEPAYSPPVFKEVERRGQSSPKPRSVDAIIRSGRFYTVNGGKSIKLNNIYIPQSYTDEADIVEKPKKKKGWLSKG